MDLLSTHPIKTSDLGFHGNLFGGAALAWMDASAVSYAMRLCAEPRMLTLSLEDCHFKKPVKEGEVLSLYGFPCHLGRSSIRIAVEARVLNLTTQEEWTVLCACLRFVCVDGQGKSKPISEAARERIAGLLGGQTVAAAMGLGGMEGLNGGGAFELAGSAGKTITHGQRTAIPRVLPGGPCRRASARPTPCFCSLS